MSNQSKQSPNEKPEQSIFNSCFEWVHNLFQQSKSDKVPVVAMMSYDEALKYFIQERPKNNHNIKKGAIFLEKQNEGYFLMWAFLDKDEELVLDDKGNPYGRQVIAQKLDKELAETFGDGHLIVVE